MITIVALVVGAVAGFVAGVLVGRRNKQTVEKAVSSVGSLTSKL